MLSDNIKNLRKGKGLSQEELAIKLNVVRQTVSKWEKGLSVPDSEMLIKIAEELETSTTVLLGENIKADENWEIKEIANKLSSINEQIAKDKESKRRNLRIVFVVAAVIALFVVLGGLISVIYFQIAMNEIETNTSIIGGYDGPTNIVTARSAFRFVPLILSIVAAVASFIGIYKTRKK